MTTTLAVPRRFCGPAASGNGGWTAGAIATLVAPTSPVEVTLRRPPPLDTPLTLDAESGVGWNVHDGDLLIAQARVVADDELLTPVAPVDATSAVAAQASYAGLQAHPFPTCFSCGPARAPGDGLRIFPGRLDDGSDRVAATWVPHQSLVADGEVPLAVVWSALDCVGGWATDLDERPMVLGRITAVVHQRPSAGRDHVVVGVVRRRDGRRTHTASSLYDDTGVLMARAAHVWFEIDPRDFAPSP